MSRLENDPPKDFSKEGRKRIRKVHVYIPPDMIEEIEKVAKQLQISISYILTNAWRIAKDEIKSAPVANWIEPRKENVMRRKRRHK